MARVPTLSDVSVKQYRTHVGPGAVKIGAGDAANDYSGMGSTLASIGLTDGGLEWAPNVETTTLMSDQLYNPYDVVLTAWSHQVTVTMDQVDLWNIALGMGYDGDATSASSILSFDGYQPYSAFRCAQVVTGAASDTATLNSETQYLEFYKVKVFATGSMTYSRTDKTQIPITIYCLGNSSDVAGQLRVSEAITQPSYDF